MPAGPAFETEAWGRSDEPPAKEEVEVDEAGVRREEAWLRSVSPDREPESSGEDCSASLLEDDRDLSDEVGPE